MIRRSEANKCPKSPEKGGSNPFFCYVAAFFARVGGA